MSTQSFQLSIAHQLVTVSVPTAPANPSLLVLNGLRPFQILDEEQTPSGGLAALYMGCYNLSYPDDFLTDCRAMAQYITNTYGNVNDISSYEKALEYAVSQHINRCGRLIAGDMLTYLDTFAYLVKSVLALDDSIVKAAYARNTKRLITRFSNSIKVNQRSFMGMALVEWDGSSVQMRFNEYCRDNSL